LRPSLRLIGHDALLGSKVDDGGASFLEVVRRRVAGRRTVDDSVSIGCLAAANLRRVLPHGFIRSAPSEKASARPVVAEFFRHLPSKRTSARMPILDQRRGRVKEVQRETRKSLDSNTRVFHVEQ
jgi:hypothetical protein